MKENPNHYRIYFDTDTIAKGNELQEFYDLHSVYRIMQDVGSICRMEKTYLEKHGKGTLDEIAFGNLITMRGKLVINMLYQGTINVNKRTHGNSDLKYKSMSSKDKYLYLLSSYEPKRYDILMDQIKKRKDN